MLHFSDTFPDNLDSANGIYCDNTHRIGVYNKCRVLRDPIPKAYQANHICCSKSKQLIALNMRVCDSILDDFVKIFTP